MKYPDIKNILGYNKHIETLLENDNPIFRNYWWKKT